MELVRCANCGQLWSGQLTAHPCQSRVFWPNLTQAQAAELLSLRAKLEEARKVLSELSILHWHPAWNRETVIKDYPNGSLQQRVHAALSPTDTRSAPGFTMTADPLKEQKEKR